jgi:hypothetical protein
LDGYREAATAQALDADLVRITGCLMLARLEGASPINYLDELDVADVKRRAVELITEPVADLRAAVVQVLP